MIKIKSLPNEYGWVLELTHRKTDDYIIVRAKNIKNKLVNNLYLSRVEAGFIVDKLKKILEQTK
jgi:hypothetical protein